VKGSDNGGSASGANNNCFGHSFISGKKDFVKGSNLSDVSSLAELQEMAFSLQGPSSGGTFLPIYNSKRKGPSSIVSGTSVSTVKARCSGHISDY